MKDSRINYVAVGAFVIAMIVALVVVLAIVSGGTAATDTYKIRLSNVQGLRIGTKVTYEGFEIGQVEKIAPVPEGEKGLFDIQVGIQEGWKIPKDSVAKITSSGLIAAISINIRAGKSDTLLEEGDIIPSEGPTGLIPSVTDVAESFDELKEREIVPLLKNLNKVAANLAKIVDEENTQRARSIIKDLEQTTANLERTRRELNKLVGNMNEMVSRNKPRLNRAVDDFAHTMDALARNIDSITQNLDGTSRNLLEFSREIRQNPSLLIGSKSREDEAQR